MCSWTPSLRKNSGNFSFTFLQTLERKVFLALSLLLKICCWFRNKRNFKNIRKQPFLLSKQSQMLQEWTRAISIWFCFKLANNKRKSKCSFRIRLYDSWLVFPFFNSFDDHKVHLQTDVRCLNPANMQRSSTDEKPRSDFKAKNYEWSKTCKKLCQIPTANNNCRLPISHRFFIGLFRRHALLGV